MSIQSKYQEAALFAAEKHQIQNVPGTKANYFLHLSNVAMEILIASSHTPNFDVEFAIQVALLHDTLEDTHTSFAEITEIFGPYVAQAVLALTKDDQLPQEEQIFDSIERIKKLQPEVWAVKLADRISNLQPPPEHWNGDRVMKYKEQSEKIHLLLKDGNEYLAKRLDEVIKKYP
ncbi:HD domain-containing protein [Namhaeicola litoreus]|uniref:HD domain-containing protein n=1 Tax=Namhaeicola litoreus TaxID=1052145 RepID=A0ABW3XXT9_9FLAO